MAVELPCDADGMCMVCKIVPEESKVLVCNGCASPWHMGCLNPPLENVPTSDWFCPDCNLPPASDTAPTPAVPNLPSNDLIIGQIRAIQNDPSLSAQEKARKCQDLMSKAPEKNSDIEAKKSSSNKMLDIFDENLNCTFCMQIAERPVTTPCGHNFCLKCFQRWIGQGKKICGKCRTSIPPKMMSNPRINSALVIAIRMAKAAVNPSGTLGPPKPYQYIQNKDRPDKAYTTERAKKTGKANASSGKIFVTTPPDHFGPITAENDPVRGQGVLVGETWEDRLECRQWGAHLPHVAGIAGQSDYGSQSVALSGGYEDDEDHGEWFLYTGSGGRDLSGNKRTNNKQSFDQKFEKSNKALRVSCKNGYPVRVVRSHKEKRSSYAPESGVRYDGVYRIEKCWRKVGMQGFRVCRYLFVRCDNEPAPWTSDEHGDRPRPLPKIDELKGAVDITERKSSPSWDWKEETGRWEWTKPPPISRKAEEAAGGPRSSRKAMSFGQRLLKEFGCDLCRKVLSLPISAPCGHNFCKSCLDATFKGQEDIRQRTGVGGRSLRAQKVVKRCPSCQGDITDFLVNPQVNRQMEEVIQSLRKSGEADESDGEDGTAGTGKEDDESASVEGGTHKAKDQSSDEKCETSSVIVQGNEELDQEVEQKDGSEDDSSTKVSNASNLSMVAEPEAKLVFDPVKEKAFQNLCAKYTDYSEDLLRSMLADQDGDVLELDYLLKALHRNQKKASRMKAAAATDGEDSSSQVEPSRNTSVQSPVKKTPAKRKYVEPSEVTAAVTSPTKKSSAKRKNVEPSEATAAVKSPVKKSPAKRKNVELSGAAATAESPVKKSPAKRKNVEPSGATATVESPVKKSPAKRKNVVLIGATATAESPVKKSPAKRKNVVLIGATATAENPAKKSPAKRKNVVLIGATATVKSPAKKSPAKRKKSRVSGQSSRFQKKGVETEVESNSDDEVIVERSVMTPLRKSSRKRRNEVEPVKSPNLKLKKFGARAKPLQVDSDTDFE